MKFKKLLTIISLTSIGCILLFTKPQITHTPIPRDLQVRPTPWGDNNAWLGLKTVNSKFSE